MDKANVVTNSYKEALDGKKVLEAIFTTYTLSTDFFEAEVMWLLSGKDADKFSPNDDVRRMELATYFQKNRLPITIYFDRKVNDWDADEQDQTISPLMEYLLVPINSGNHSFHPKISLLLLEDNKSKEQSILYVSGSNNLTYNGWWENVECVNMEMFSKSEAVNINLINNCSEILEYLSNKRKGFSNEETPFKRYTDLLTDLKVDNNPNELYYSSFGNKIQFDEFIKSSFKIDEFNLLEVVSPYFAEDDMKTIELLNSIKHQECTVKLYLPKNEENELLCTEELFNRVNESNNINWASFNEEISNDIQLKQSVKIEDEEVHRRRNVHAKIFHWHNTETQSSVYFFGSVNLSYKAFNENEETGKLLYVDNGQELLDEKIPEEPQFAKDMEKNEDDKSKSSKVDEAFASISLLYDWKLKKLYSILENKDFKINDFSIDIGNIKVLKEEIFFEDDCEAIESSLYASSFLSVLYENNSKQIFVNQKNFTHKSLDLGSLSAKEILDIYMRFGTDLDENEFIRKAIERALQSKGILSDTTLLDTNTSIRNFFSEYSEIFAGLRNLKHFLQKDEVKKDYFLDEDSKAIDSIPMLIIETLKDETVDIVSKYITLLYIKQIYRDMGLNQKYINNKLDELKSNNDEFKKDENFIAWFEKAFYIENLKGSENEQQV